MDLQHLLTEVTKALKPGGVFLIYDDIDWHWKNQPWMALAYLVVPSHESFFTRIKKVYRRLVYRETIILNPKVREEIPKDTGVDSPFEMVHGADIIDLVHDHFTIHREETSVAITLALYFFITQGPKSLAFRHRYRILKIVKFIEDILIKLGLAKGTMILIKATKKPSQETHLA